jgi:hypothetical protein
LLTSTLISTEKRQQNVSLKQSLHLKQKRQEHTNNNLSRCLNSWNFRGSTPEVSISTINFVNFDLTWESFKTWGWFSMTTSTTFNTLDDSKVREQKVVTQIEILTRVYRSFTNADLFWSLSLDIEWYLTTMWLYQFEKNVISMKEVEYRRMRSSNSVEGVTIKGNVKINVFSNLSSKFKSNVDSQSTKDCRTINRGQG